MTPPGIRFIHEGRLVGETDFCEPQLNLLAHAQAIELAIGSRCGGHGICGGDRVRLKLNSAADMGAALSPITVEEREHLSDEEIAQGFRLACQCFPNVSTLSLNVEIFV